jgi:hypothetical protein
MQGAVKQNAVMQSVIMLNVVAPWSNAYAGIHHMSQAPLTINLIMPYHMIHLKFFQS